MPGLLQLMNQTITTAQAGSAPVIVTGLAKAKSLGIYCNFIYGAAGTTADVYVQTSFDGGLTWCDVCNFHNLLVSNRLYFNICSSTPVTTEDVINDVSTGSPIPNNTCKDGIVGDQWRAWLVTTGTYTTNTTVQVFAVARA